MQDFAGNFHWPEHWHTLFYSGLLFLASQIAGRVANFFSAPRIIGYLLIGVLLGPYCFSLFSEIFIDKQVGLLSEIALVIIAYSVGGALKLEQLREVKGSILWITILQALGALVIVSGLAMILLPVLVTNYNGSSFSRIYLPLALLLGAISVPTAPAAILGIIHELKAKGRFTTVLLGVVALDDALAIIIYGIVLVWAKVLIVGTPFSLSSMLILPAISLIISLGIGSLIALIIILIINFFAPRDVMLGLIIGAILLTAGLANSFDVSPLLATMILGFVVMNFAGHDRASEAHEVIEAIEEPLFGVFFLLAGAHLNFELATKTLFITLLLLVGRFVGKYLGTKLGARMANATPVVKKYLGIALFPSAGVTIGLIMNARHVIEFISPQLVEILVSAVLGKTLINELITPFFVRYALISSKEAQLETPLKFAPPRKVFGRFGSLVAHRRNHRKQNKKT